MCAIERSETAAPKMSGMAKTFDCTPIHGTRRAFKPVSVGSVQAGHLKPPAAPLRAAHIDLAVPVHSTAGCEMGGRPTRKDRQGGARGDSVGSWGERHAHEEDGRDLDRQTPPGRAC